MNTKKPIRRAFEVTALKHFSNFHTLKHFIVISDKMPLREDVPLKDTDEMVEVKEIYAEVVIK